MKVEQAAIQYFGGKFDMAPFIIQHFPQHRVYVEPYGGGGSVLLRKTPSPIEIYNDLDDQVVNFFKVLRDRDKAEELYRQIYLTPISRTEYEDAWNRPHEGSDIERARRLCLSSLMGFGTVRAGKHGNGAPSGFRAYPERSQGSLNKIWRWRTWPSHIPSYCERLQKVIIEQKPALELIRQWDGPDTLFYLDPPYLHDTRVTDKKDYSYEMTRKDHIQLARLLRSIKGMAVVSGYESELYAKLYRGWQVIRKTDFTFSGVGNGGAKRTEVLWINRNVGRKWLL